MLINNALVGFNAGRQSGGRARVAFVANYQNDNNETVYTFAGCSLGTPDSKRRVVVGVKTVGGNFSGVTIAGIAATQVAIVTNTYRAAIYIAHVPAGLTGTIEVTMDSTAERMGIAVWDLRTSSNTASATSTATGDPSTTTIDVPAGGAAIAFCQTNDSTSVVWTGLTEDVDTNVELSNYSGASQEFSTAQTGLSVSANFGTAGSGMMCVASWGTQ